MDGSIVMVSCRLFRLSLFGFWFSVLCFWGKKVGLERWGLEKLEMLGTYGFNGHGFVSWVRGVLGMVWYGLDFFVGHMMREREREIERAV